MPRATSTPDAESPRAELQTTQDAGRGELARRSIDAEIENVLINGDLARLQPGQRVSYYRELCASLGLNPLTKPFDYIELSGRLTLYAKKDATDQLRAIHGVSIQSIDGQLREVGRTALFVVTATAVNREGRTDVATGAVAITSSAGDALANAIMKAETKAKRRVTLSLCGLGFLDESETGTIPDAAPARINMETGEIIETPSQTAQDAPQGAQTDAGATIADDGYLRVMRLRVVRRGQNSRGNWTMYAVHFNDGTQAITFDEEIAETARRAGQGRLPVDVETRAGRGRDPELVSLSIIPVTAAVDPDLGDDGGAHPDGDMLPDPADSTQAPDDDDLPF